MKFLVVFLCFFCSNLALSSELEADIAVDFKQFSGQKNAACLLLQDYTARLNSPDLPLDSKKHTARKIATILGQGKGVGGFSTRKATDEEKIIMLKALDVAYQHYPLEDNDFFTESSSNLDVKKHQSILWALSKTMAVKSILNMDEQKQTLKQKRDAILTEPQSQDTYEKVERIYDEILELESLRRDVTVKICGRFDDFQKHYQDLISSVERKDFFKQNLKALIAHAGLSGYDPALEISENLLDLMGTESSFVRKVLIKTEGDIELLDHTHIKNLVSLSLNTKPHTMYDGSIFDVVSVYTYNPVLGKTSVAIRRQDEPNPKLGHAVESALAGLQQVDYDIVLQTGFSDESPYLLRPHGWTDPNGETRSRDVSAGFFESRGITINGQAADTMGNHNVNTHGVASPNNMPLNLPQRNLEPDEFYSFISVVKDVSRNGNKGVVTLHGFGGEFVNEDILKLAALLGENTITAGDLFLLMHYSPVLSKNPHFLKLLIQWLG
jgi:hypothetical protein